MQCTGMKANQTQLIMKQSKIHFTVLKAEETAAAWLWHFYTTNNKLYSCGK